MDFEAYAGIDCPYYFVHHLDSWLQYYKMTHLTMEEHSVGNDYAIELMGKGMLSIFESIVRFKGMNFRCTTMSTYPLKFDFCARFLNDVMNIVGRISLCVELSAQSYDILIIWYRVVKFKMRSRVLLCYPLSKLTYLSLQSVAGVDLRKNPFQEESNDENQGVSPSEQFNFPLDQSRRHGLRSSRTFYVLIQELCSQETSKKPVEEGPHEAQKCISLIQVLEA